MDCSPQDPLSMGFSRQEHWSGLPFPSPGGLPNPGIEPRSPALPADSLPSEPPGKPQALGTPVISHTTLDPWDRSYSPLPHLQICDAGGLGPPGLQQVLDAGPAPEPCNGSLCPWRMVAVIHHRASFPVGGLSLPPEPHGRDSGGMLSAGLARLDPHPGPSLTFCFTWLGPCRGQHYMGLSTAPVWSEESHF